MKIFAIILFILCAILLVGVAITDHQQMLPDKIVSQFGGNGSPTSYMSRSSFTWTMITVGIGIPALIIGIMYTIRFLPTQFLNVPNPTYWKNPKNYRKACDFLFTSSLWFASAFLIWLILFSRMIVAANQVSPPHLDSKKITLLTILLLVFTFVWVIVLIMRFLKADNK